MPLSVLIAEKNNLLLEVLKDIFIRRGFTIVRTTSRKSDIFPLAMKIIPDLLVFDFSLSNDGIAGLIELKHLKEKLPKLKILVMGHQETDSQFAEAILNAGFDGFWCKYGSKSGFNQLLNSFFCHI